MIKTNELRIGNLIFADFGDGPKAQILGSGNDIQGTVDHLDNYDPIPLTEEWLEKFGFVDCSDCVSLELNEPYQRILLLHNEWPLLLEIDSCRMPIFNLKYVHQLQNLFFALVGEELTIKEMA